MAADQSDSAIAIASQIIEMFHQKRNRSSLMGGASMMLDNSVSPDRFHRSSPTHSISSTLSSSPTKSRGRLANNAMRNFLDSDSKLKRIYLQR